jgi:hypothetical protein
VRHLKSGCHSRSAASETSGAKSPPFLLVGGFNHLEKYESQWEGLSHILWKIKHV